MLTNIWNKCNNTGDTKLQKDVSLWMLNRRIKGKSILWTEALLFYSKNYGVNSPSKV